MLLNLYTRQYLSEKKSDGRIENQTNQKYIRYVKANNKMSDELQYWLDDNTDNPNFA